MASAGYLLGMTLNHHPEESFVLPGSPYAIISEGVIFFVSGAKWASLRLVILFFL